MFSYGILKLQPYMVVTEVRLKNAQNIQFPELVISCCELLTNIDQDDSRH